MLEKYNIGMIWAVLEVVSNIYIEEHAYELLLEQLNTVFLQPSFYQYNYFN